MFSIVWKSCFNRQLDAFVFTVENIVVIVVVEVISENPSIINAVVVSNVLRLIQLFI